MTTETRFLTRQPPVNYQTKGAEGVGGGARLCDQANGVWDLMAAGTPVDGAAGTGGGWAGIGSTYRDLTAGKLYINTGTAASPTWTVVGSQT